MEATKLTNAQMWLNFDLKLQSGAIWWNERKERLFSRRMRQNKRRKKKP